LTGQRFLQLNQLVADNRRQLFQVSVQRTAVINVAAGICQSAKSIPGGSNTPLSWGRGRTLPYPLHALGHFAVQPYQSLIAARDDSCVETSLLPCNSYQECAAARVIGLA
jgi:hypothetical protein